MTIKNAVSGEILELGREGENLARKITFDISDWIEEYGSGDVYLFAERFGDAGPYPVSVSVEEGIVTWMITNSDAGRHGYGKCELRYIANGVVVKSETWITYTDEALGEAMGEPPAPYESWVDGIISAKESAESAVLRASDFVNHMPIIGENGNWWAWNGSKYVDSGSFAEYPTRTSELENDSDYAYTNTNNNFSAPQTINGTLTVNGNIVQNGESYNTHAEKVYTKNDMIITRAGAQGGLASDEVTGIRAEKYDGTNNGILAFDAGGEARVGDEGDTQPLLTRDEKSNISDGQVLVWNSAELRAVGSSDFVKKTDYASETKAGIAKIWSTTDASGDVTLHISTEA